jgi:flagellin
MALRIFNNLSSTFAQNRLNVNNRNYSEVIGRIASGERGRNANALTSELLNSDVRASRQASRNVNDGISLINVAEGGLNEQAGILIRLREVITAASGVIGQQERDTLKLEINNLRNEFNRIANTTEFNGQNLLDGSLAGSIAIENQVIITTGLDSKSDSQLNLNAIVNLGSTNTAGLDLDNLSTASSEEAIAGTDNVENALNTINGYRTSIGVAQNRLERNMETLNVYIENINAAASTIKDTNIAEELAELTKQQLLVQSSSAMIGQANLIPEGVLLLLP